MHCTIFTHKHRTYSPQQPFFFTQESKLDTRSPAMALESGIVATTQWYDLLTCSSSQATIMSQAKQNNPLVQENATSSRCLMKPSLPTSWQTPHPHITSNSSAARLTMRSLMLPLSAFLLACAAVVRRYRKTRQAETSCILKNKATSNQK